MERELVTTRTISRISRIENADAIEAATVDGWTVVVRRGEFTVGEEVLYFEIDSFLPTSVKAFEFLAAKHCRTVISPEGKEVIGHLLRTVRLRGQLSQGLILKKDAVTEEEIAQVFKWEPPLPTGYGAAIGRFPDFIQKSDAERVQNVSPEFLLYCVPVYWTATEKIDGTSSTWYMDPDKGLRAFGRNWELSLEEPGLFRSIAEKYRIAEKLEPGEWVQGEIYGPGVQKNPLRVPDLRLAVFNWNERSPELIGLPRVPTYEYKEMILPNTIEEILAQVDGLKSLINPERQAEGLVWWDISNHKYKDLGYRSCFKAINNSYILSKKE